MATQPTSGLTYDDLQRFPEDNLRREIIDGELFVTAAPILRHQRVGLRLSASLFAYEEHAGGRTYPATDVFFSEVSVVEPDVVFVRAEQLERLGEKYIASAPDLVVEISSPSTRRVDLGRKLELYERYRVPEYWFVDLDQDRVMVHLLEDGGYADARLIGRGEILRSVSLPGFEIAVDDLLAG